EGKYYLVVSLKHLGYTMQIHTLNPNRSREMGKSKTKLSTWLRSGTLALSVFLQKSSTTSTSSGRSKRTIVFNKSCLQSSTRYSETINHNNIRTTRESSPPIKQVFLLMRMNKERSSNLLLIPQRKQLTNFLSKMNLIPSEIVKKSVAKQCPPISNDFSGNYEVALSNKENIDEEIVRRLVNKDLQKRKLDEVLELEETEKGSKKKILELAMNDNEYMTKFLESIRTEERKEQVLQLSLRVILFALGGVVSRFLPDSGGLAEDKRSSLFRVPSANLFY
ncbi:8220_t:CDS:2, partial [Acaulospora morrowiae]